MTGGSEMARFVNSTGDFLIGTTTDDGTDKLQVGGSASIGGALAVAGNTTVQGTFMAQGAIASHSTIRCNAGGDLSMGSFTAGTAP